MIVHCMQPLSLHAIDHDTLFLPAFLKISSLTLFLLLILLQSNTISSITLCFSDAHTCHMLWTEISEIRQIFQGDLIKLFEIFTKNLFVTPPKKPKAFI